MHRYLVILAAALAACSGSDKDTTGDTGAAGDDDDNACTNSITAQFPENGATDVYYKTDVRFTLVAEDPTATVVLTDAAGATVNGSSTSSGLLVTWSGDDLQPSTTYTATLTYECGEASVSWTTSNVGGPTTVDLTGRVYGLDPANGQWVQPQGVGDLLASQLGDTQIFLAVTAVGATDITMIGAIGSANVQDECSPSIAFPPANWTDPYFSLQSDALPLEVSGFTINIENLDLSGAFAPDGSMIAGGSLKGSVDTRPLGEAFGLDGGDNAVCDLVSTFGVPCEDCGNGEIYCLSVWVDSMNAPYLPSTIVTEITPEQAAINCP